jgi:hypothetical protein
MIDVIRGIDASKSDSAMAIAMQARLKESLSAFSHDLAIVVLRQCGLLARYSLDLRPVFGWLTSRRLLVLLCPPVDVRRLAPVPDGLVLAPKKVGEAFKSIVPPDQIVEAA